MDFGISHQYKKRLTTKSSRSEPPCIHLHGHVAKFVSELSVLYSQVKQVCYYELIIFNFSVALEFSNQEKITIQGFTMTVRHGAIPGNLIINSIYIYIFYKYFLNELFSAC